jgi:hypothetical protein
MMRAEQDLEAPTSVIASYLRKTISLSYLVGLVWTGRLLIVIAAVLGFLYGIYTVYKAGPAYTATVRVSPAANDATLGDVANTSSLLAGLAGGAGVNQVPKFVQFTYAISSVEVARDLEQKYDLLCRLYKGECDPLTHQWKARTGIREFIASSIARLSGLPDPNVGPRSATDLADYIAGQIVVAQLKKTDSVYALSYVHRDPQFASQFVSLVIKAANDYVRAQNRETQKRYVDYLTVSATKATNVEQRQAIDTLLLQEERQLMLTEVDVPYAAKILDGPTVTPVNRALKTIAVNTVLGLLLGIALAVSRDLIPRKWRRW